MRTLRWRSLIVFALFVIALAIRIDGITGPPLDASPYASHAVVIRQYHSALLARAYFLDWRDSSTFSDRQLAAGIKEDEKLVEPPLLELAAGSIYLLTDGERLWVPRLLVAITWLLGGAFLLRLAGRISSPLGALVTLAIYLLLPFGVVVGRAFQPDGLMVAMILGACLAAVRFGENPTRQRFAVAAAAAAGASFVKPGWSLFFLVPLFFSVTMRQGYIRKSVIQTSAYTMIAVLPTAAYIAYGLFIRDFLGGQAADKVQPELLLDRSTWTGWLAMIGDVLDPVPLLRPHGPASGLALLAVGLASAAVALRRGGRFLVPLWVGYFVFGAFFATHTQDHNYYSLVLVPIVALSIGTALPRLTAALRRAHGAETALACAIIAVLGAGALALHRDLNPASYGQEAAAFERIGQQIRHQSAITLGPYYGEPIQYHGRFRSRWWPTEGNVEPTEEDVTPAQRLARSNRTYWPSVGAMKPPPAFFLADLGRLSGEPALRRYLRTLPEVATIGDYAIYELGEPSQ